MVYKCVPKLLSFFLYFGSSNRGFIIGLIFSACHCFLFLLIGPGGDGDVSSSYSGVSIPLCFFHKTRYVFHSSFS